MLADWLLAAGQPRQKYSHASKRSAELRSNLALREDIALLSEDVRPGRKSEIAGRWGAAPAIHVPGFPAPGRVCSGVAGIAAIVGVFGHFFPCGLCSSSCFATFALIFAFRTK